MTEHFTQERVVFGNPIATYYDNLLVLAKDFDAKRVSGQGFSPSFELPELTSRWERFFASTPVSMCRLPAYGGGDFVLLDLMGNPWTRTTKSLASLTMVARAIRHSREHGERVVIVTPTSGNKGTALRDAIARAIQLGLANPGEVRLVMAVPAASRGKLRANLAGETPQFAQENPVVVASVEQPGEVKSWAAEAATSLTPQAEKTGTRIWYSLDLDNYRFADALRALIERDSLGADPGRRRWHIHAVSSGYGLLGYHLGRTRFGLAPEEHPRFLLVQHLRTSDMVRAWREETGDPPGVPPYSPNPGGLFGQTGDPAFPYVTASLDESIDATFYTSAPPTIPAMNEILRRHGGAGIVVSRDECVQRYAEIRDLLRSWEVLPSEADALREWSLVMAMCGAMNAVDRGTVPAGAQMVVHGSGCYWDDWLAPLPSSAVSVASTPAQLREVIGEVLRR